MTKSGKERGYPTWTKITHPDTAAKISKIMIDNQVNVGDKNPMKRTEVREKMSISRKKMLEKKDIRIEIAKKTRQAWADGKFDGVKVGQCKWFSYILKSGDKVKAQGTWELAFIVWADSNGLKFQSHKGRISYVDDLGNNKNYYPDFFVQDWNSYVEIKNEYHYNLQKHKFENIIKSNPNLKIKLLFKKDLIEMGVRIK